MGAELTQIGPQNNNTSSAMVDFEFGTVAEFRKRLLDLKEKHDFLKEFFQSIMVKDEDFGVVPGTQKSTLYKPGAEKLCELYGFAAQIKNKEEDRDFDSGYYRVSYTIQIIHRNTGVVVGEGVGECSTFESKYRYRWVYENKIPKHLDKDSLFFEVKDKWVDGVVSGSYNSYRIPNEDLHSQWNTVNKMSYKRAYVAGVLQCTRSSSIFTQEEAEMDEFANVPVEDRKKVRTPRGNQSSGNQPRANSTPAGGSASGTTTSGGIAAAKNRTLALMKTANLDWNGLAGQATETLGRSVKKVVDDIKTEADWNLVSQALEVLIESRAAYDQSGELNFDDLPADLRGEP